MERRRSDGVGLGVLFEVIRNGQITPHEAEVAGSSSSSCGRIIRTGLTDSIPVGNCAGNRYFSRAKVIKFLGREPFGGIFMMHQ